jgi:hypothetical protein
VYATLFGIGKLVFGYTGTGIIMLAVAAVAFYWISQSFRSEPAPHRPSPSKRPTAA